MVPFVSWWLIFRSFFAFPSVYSLQSSVSLKRLPARADFQYAMARKHPGHARDVRPYAVFSIGPREEHVAPREALQSAARLREARRRSSVGGHARLSRYAALCKIACRCAGTRAKPVAHGTTSMIEYRCRSTTAGRPQQSAACFCLFLSVLGREFNRRGSEDFRCAIFLEKFAHRQ